MHKIFSNLKGFDVFMFYSEGDGDGWSILFGFGDKEINMPCHVAGDGIGCSEDYNNDGDGRKLDYNYGVGYYGYNDGDGEPEDKDFSLFDEEEPNA